MSSLSLELLLPDWHYADTVLRSPEPFALWETGDQPLLYHWLDYAVNERCNHVRLFVADRPDAVRAAMQRATLWPVGWEVVPVASTGDVRANNALPVTGLPWYNLPEDEVAPSSGWELLEHWFALERSWLDTAIAQSPLEGFEFAIGQGARIHPTAILRLPFYIGDGAVIGEGCEIGPHASVGAGSMVAAYNRVTHSKISRQTILGPHTALDRCFLQGGLLANLKHRGLVPKVDAFLADSWDGPPRKPADRPGVSERLEALFFWGLIRSLSCFKPLPNLARNRLPQIAAAALGKTRLYGILPRSRQQLDALDPEWAGILTGAPTGAISLADVHGCHETGDLMEPLHAVYQCTHPDGEVVPYCRALLRSLVVQTLKGFSRELPAGDGHVPAVNAVSSLTARPS